ncbi:MAG: M20/M25/M40 family metallo-hydrolase, partial [Clostridia bacterium]|nr:M20/M25/M40 family metallo-hydrolase [Clostridia bacterium]
MKKEINKEQVDVERVSEKLSKAIQIPTIAQLDEEGFDWSEFEKFHKFLEESFPLIHKTLKREVICHADLVYIWEGSDSSLEPIAFLSHQDVVPVTPGTEGDWTHPAFAGEIADGYIWGRGAIDMKNQLISVMESIETLLEEGYKPVRSVYLCFGHNEEIMSEKNSGAMDIVKEMQKRGIRFDSIIDEGG